MKKENIIIAGVIALMVAIWLFRYEVSPIHSGPGAYLLDRWTGKVSFIAVDQKRPTVWADE